MLDPKNIAENFLNEDYFVVDLSTLQSQASNQVIQVISLNDSFFKMIQVLKSYSVIGVVFLGNEISREKPIDFIAFSCSQANYFIVVNEESMKFLKEILESNLILKIIHGCHIVSDALFHQHNIKLSYIYDTMVIDALLRKKNLKKKIISQSKTSKLGEVLNFLSWGQL